MFEIKLKYLRVKYLVFNFFSYYYICFCKLKDEKYEYYLFLKSYKNYNAIHIRRIVGVKRFTIWIRFQ